MRPYSFSKNKEYVFQFFHQQKAQFSIQSVKAFKQLHLSYEVYGGGGLVIHPVQKASNQRHGQPASTDI